MPNLHVCSLARLHETVAGDPRQPCGDADQHAVLSSSARHPVTGRPAPVFSRQRHRRAAGRSCRCRPRSIVRTLLSFVRAWDRASPLVFHCWAGVSRSTAAAYISACSLAPDRDEAEIAAGAPPRLADRDAERAIRRAWRTTCLDAGADGVGRPGDRPGSRLHGRHALHAENRPGLRGASGRRGLSAVTSRFSSAVRLRYHRVPARPPLSEPLSNGPHDRRSPPDRPPFREGLGRA